MHISRSSALSVLAIVGGASTGTGFHLGDGVVSLSIESRLRRHVQRDVHSKATVPPPVVNLVKPFYNHLIPVNIGTPPQLVQLVLDTGAWEFWVSPDCATAPEAQQQICLDSGHYLPEKSTTAKSLNDTDEIFRYSSTGSIMAQVGWVNDTISIGEAKLDTYRVGVARSGRGIGIGLFGLGPHPNPDVGFTDSNATSGYGGVLAGLVRGGVVARRAYSVSFLGGETPGSAGGSLMFGGIDKNRFRGPLFKTAVIAADQAPQKSTRFWARVKTFGNRLPGSNTTTPLEIGYQDFLLDSGTTESVMPPPVAAAAIAAMGGTKTPDGITTIDCASLANMDGALVLSFPEGNIEIPYRNFVIDTRGMSGFEGLGCIVAISELQVGALPILGLALFRSAYAVFDLDTPSIGLAQASVSCGTPEALPIGAEGIPTVGREL